MQPQKLIYILMSKILIGVVAIIGELDLFIVITLLVIGSVHHRLAQMNLFLVI